MDHKSNPVERTTRQEKEGKTLNPLGRRSQKISWLRLYPFGRISGFRRLQRGAEWRIKYGGMLRLWLAMVDNLLIIGDEKLFVVDTI
ncbi:hypothetical protein EVAR_89332_1 [Eumeta japonica]|uniref:Uncharacterized protein n=1 Tax=Eumeta variegata TaxID=151549 RepID=A0A4C1Y5K0_EUMVA|nr:hypothetical protein EVAR_89332_1 [Eumeta japonica]